MGPLDNPQMAQLRVGSHLRTLFQMRTTIAWVNRIA